MVKDYVISLLIVLAVWAIRIVFGMILWNIIMVGALGLPMLNFGQFILLTWLGRIITGGGIKGRIRKVYVDKGDFYK